MESAWKICGKSMDSYVTGKGKLIFQGMYINVHYVLILIHNITKIGFILLVPLNIQQELAES